MVVFDLERYEFEPDECVPTGVQRYLTPQTGRSTRVSAHPPTQRAMFLGSQLVAGNLPVATSAFSRLCTLQREFCSRCNVKLLHPLKFNGISRAKPLAS